MSGANTGQNAGLEQQIAALNKGVLNLQALADRARANGNFIRAQALSTQAVQLSGQVNDLSEARRNQAIQSEAWQQLSTYLDALNSAAQRGESQMQEASDNVATAKSIIGLVSSVVEIL